jgi:hypothetical protein
MHKGPVLVKGIQGFDPVHDLVFKYRINLTKDLFKSYCSLFLNNNPLSEFCQIISPPDMNLLDKNCYYNYYIDTGLDDEDAMGMYFSDHTDIEIFIAFRKVKCKY